MPKIAYSPLYAHPVPENHRFPMEKYEWLHQQLILEGIASEFDFFEPSILQKQYALNVHDSGYFERFINLQLTLKEQRLTGFVHDERLVIRELTIAEGTRKCVDFAIKEGVALNIAGGTHHAFTNRGEGFCMLNDQAIGAAYYLSLHKKHKVLILDLDVHQGNGTAEIFSKSNQVFTFSMHGANNYPLKKEVSSWDIHLADQIQSNEYLSLLADALSKLSTMSFDFVFFQSGVDILASDKLGKLSVDLEGIKKRDAMVLEFCQSQNIPLVICMGGGYSPDTKVILEAHMSTFRQAFLSWNSL